MNKTRTTAILSVAALLAGIGCEKREPTSTTPPITRNEATRQTPTPPPPRSVAPDNTANNKGDASDSAKTPMDQSQADENVELSAEIRRAIVADSNLSTNAQNCKIITDKSGLVTLRGVVDSQAEKDAIESIAKGVAGVTNVDNQLEVKGG